MEKNNILHMNLKKLHKRRQHYGCRYKNRVLRQLPDEIIACAYCGDIVEKATDSKQKSNTMTVDHITPISKGGNPSNIDNVLICCRKCNSDKKDKVINIDYLVAKLSNMLPIYKIIE